MPFTALSARECLFPEYALSRDDRLRPGRESRASSRESVRYEKWGKRPTWFRMGEEANPPKRTHVGEGAYLYIERVGHTALYVFHVPSMRPLVDTRAITRNARCQVAEFFSQVRFHICTKFEIH